MIIEKSESRILGQDEIAKANRDTLMIYPKLGAVIEQACFDIVDILHIDLSKNLDLVGRVVGVGRFFEDVKLTYRTIGTNKAHVGNDFARCAAPDWSLATDLSDEIFRAVIRAKIIKNTSDCTIGDIEEALTRIVSSSIVQVVDKENMTFGVKFIGRLDDIERYVVDNYNLIPTPQGVRFIGYVETEVTVMCGKKFAVCGNHRAVCRKESEPI